MKEHTQEPGLTVSGGSQGDESKLRSYMRLPDDGSMPVTLGVGSGAGNLYVYGPYEAIKVCQEKLLRIESLERDLADEKGITDTAVRAMEHVEHQLADERKLTSGQAQDIASAYLMLRDLQAERDGYKAHMGEAWQEYRRLWFRWFEQRVESRYAKKREREAQGYKALAERRGEEIDSLRTALNRDGHVLEFREDGWAIEHPVECRSGSLLDCRFSFLCNEMGGPPEEGLGRYKAGIDGNGNLLLTALAATPEEADKREGR